jgi:hypothetical protein
MDQKSPITRTPNSHGKEHSNVSRNTRDTIVALESTGNGMGGYFYDLCDRSEKGLNNWHLFFISGTKIQNIKKRYLPVRCLSRKAAEDGEIEVEPQKNIQTDYMNSLYWRRYRSTTTSEATYSNSCRNTPPA